jgi:hypothetical protein
MAFSIAVVPFSAHGELHLVAVPLRTLSYHPGRVAVGIYERTNSRMMEWGWSCYTKYVSHSSVLACSSTGHVDGDRCLWPRKTGY